MAGFMVNAAQLKTKAEELKALAEKYKESVQKLVEEEEALRGMWEGDASNTFHDVFSQDKIQMDNFRSAVLLYTVKLNSAAERYILTESKNIEILRARK